MGRSNVHFFQDCQKCVLLAFFSHTFFGHTFLQSGSERGERGKIGILLSKDTIVEGARQGSDPVSS